MERTRALLAGLLTALSLCFLGLLARTIVEGVQVGQVQQSTISMLIVTGFLIVASAVAVTSQGRMAQWSARSCARCGAAVYATIRSYDRRKVLTCFTCGHEIVTG